MLDEHEFRSPHGLLAYEFYEKILPFHRRPLVDKASRITNYEITKLPLSNMVKKRV